MPDPLSDPEFDVNVADTDMGLYDLPLLCDSHVDDFIQVDNSFASSVKYGQMIEQRPHLVIRDKKSSTFMAEPHNKTIALPVFCLFLVPPPLQEASKRK